MTDQTTDRPEWESPGELTIGDALSQAIVAYGATARVAVTAMADPVPPMTARLDARHRLDAYPPEPDAYPKFPADMPYGETERIRAEANERWREWYDAKHLLERQAWPYRYSVGYGDNAMSYRMSHDESGRTWEEVLEKARILGATKRLDVRFGMRTA